MKRILMLPLAAAVSLLLSGCLYPQDELESKQTPYEDQLEMVQKAVDTYQTETDGLLPIKTRDQGTDPYIKYPIEFSKIVPSLTEKIPSNAYEQGGIYQYVLMDVEEDPTVKLVDLRVAERIRELILRKTVNGVLPFKDAIQEGANVYEIDFKKMGLEKPLTVESPYSDAHLPLVVGGDGNFYIDYSIDLARILERDKPDVKPGEDIRHLLADRYPILPAYSLPYTVDENNEVIFLKSSN
ncbi:hypothetical protein NCCP2716_04380 [Sporosarcina sp. NCCP-2716]|uniref:hypothetical protein n=1 Tax=Sporosarcina sp. NCCP-2716 TaxID=2943679 RepID=UPI00203F0209|nr:hypothetical protein [Sporosarcina sp. NCCP-2716]GKV67940.1 hypothetical protein NCCP2716_04380 [Sporosarcina sp. NCCP-2716]